jgi:hypothetical protein
MNYSISNYKKILIYILTIFFSKMLYSVDKEFVIKDINKFELKSVSGNFYRNTDLYGKQGTLLIFFSNHCKVSQKFQNYINLINNFSMKGGIKTLVISPNFENAILPDELAYTDVGDSFEEMERRAIKQNYMFPYIYDGKSQIITKSLGVKITPSAYLFNKFGNLTYSGRLGNHDNPNDFESSDLTQAVKRLSNENYVYSRTKVYGTSIKFEKDLALAEKVRNRYAKESVYINYGDEKKLNFYLKQKTRYPRFFYIWALHDDNSQTRENLINISTNYKIFRKRGLKVYTICICEDSEKELAHEILKRAQLSTLNFYSSSKEISELSKLRAASGYKTTPFCRVLNGDGTFDYGTNGIINKNSLKDSFLRMLIKE